MPRPRNSVPTYRLHKPTGQAVVTLRHPDGTRRDVYLGRHNSPESRAEYARVITEFAIKTPAAPVARASGPTVAEIILAFARHARRYYVHPDGAPTREQEDFRYSLRELRRLYGHTPAADFGPLALKAVRQQMVDAGLSRGVVNQRVGRVKRVFKWAASEELVPAATYHGLATMPGLRAGRSEAPETAPVAPAPDADVDAVLRVLTPTVRAMVEVQRLTGMRPGEVCRLRPCDVDSSGPVWVYRPARHKTSWRGKVRAVPLGPKAQAVLAPFLSGAPTAAAFSPRRSREELLAARPASTARPSRRYKRKSPDRLIRKFREAFTPQSYAAVVAKACVRAGVPHWHPNQLRHAHATAVRRRFGLEAAQVVLGHASADVTQVYAEADLALAARVAAEIG